MKTFFLFLVMCSASFANTDEIPDIMPDAESGTYASILRQWPHLGIMAFDGLDETVALGNRNMAWLNFMNESRPDGQKLSFSSKETQRGIPMDQPSEYNPTLILAQLSKLKAEMPTEMVAVIFEGKAFTRDPPVDLKIYLAAGLVLDRIYQSAIRWRMMQPWLSQLAARRARDIRGVYFLSRLENRAEKLRAFASLPVDLQVKISDWLVSMCMNNGDSLSACRRTVNEMIRRNLSLEAYYQSKLQVSLELYNSYFEINSLFARDDFHWNDSNMKVPFWDPVRADVQRFVKDNMEDEWKFGSWNLTVDFVPADTNDHPRIIFMPNITPHVNGLGGNTIFMDANQPLTEYDANWTVRHEFGHVLGLPDCYVEFYVQERESIMNYQLDIDNIMCSRRGHVKEIHYSELRKAYRN